MIEQRHALRRSTTKRGHRWHAEMARTVATGTGCSSVRPTGQNRPQRLETRRHDVPGVGTEPSTAVVRDKRPAAQTLVLRAVYRRKDGHAAGSGVVWAGRREGDDRPTHAHGRAHTHKCTCTHAHARTAPRYRCTHEIEARSASRRETRINERHEPTKKNTNEATRTIHAQARATRVDRDAVTNVTDNTA